MSRPSKSIKIAPLSDEEIVHLLGDIGDAGVTSSLALITQPFSDRIKNRPKSFSNLSLLYDENLVNKDLKQLQQIGLSINFVISEEEIRKIERLTRKQSLCKFWFIYRSGRITASLFKRCCRANLQKPPLSIIKQVCYPYNLKIKSPAIQWGKDMESKAVDTYGKEFVKRHTNFQLTRHVGLVLNKLYPYFGASPDAIVHCCCGKGTVEVKCLHRLREKRIAELDGVPKFCLLNGSLKKNHEYYFQVQMQLYITGANFADFVLWSPNELYVERIFPNREFWDASFFQASEFYFKCILPELLGKYYTR